MVTSHNAMQQLHMLTQYAKKKGIIVQKIANSQKSEEEDCVVGHVTHTLIT